MVTLKYYGGRQYKIEAEYEEGRTIATIFLDATNPKYGIGQYQYSFKNKDTNCRIRKLSITS